MHRYLVVEVKTGKYEPADLGQLSGYMAIAKHVLNTPVDNQPVGLLICREHNRVLAKYHLEELGLPMGITDYELKKVLPTKAQLAKCVTDAERQIAKAQWPVIRIRQMWTQGGDRMSGGIGNFSAVLTGSVCKHLGNLIYFAVETNP